MTSLITGKRIEVLRLFLLFLFFIAANGVMASDKPIPSEQPSPNLLMSRSLKPIVEYFRDLRLERPPRLWRGSYLYRDGETTRGQCPNQQIRVSHRQQEEQNLFIDRLVAYCGDTLGEVYLERRGPETEALTYREAHWVEYGAPEDYSWYYLNMDWAGLEAEYVQRENGYDFKLVLGASPPVTEFYIKERRTVLKVRRTYQRIIQWSSGTDVKPELVIESQKRGGGQWEPRYFNPWTGAKFPPGQKGRFDELFNRLFGGPLTRQIQRLQLKGFPVFAKGQ